MPGLDQSKPCVPLSIAVLAVSATRALEDDKSGALLGERFETAGHKLGSVQRCNTFAPDAKPAT